MDHEYVIAVAVCWLFGWLVILCVVMAIYTGLGGQDQRLPWFGKAILMVSAMSLPVLVGAGCWLFAVAGAWLWRHRPRRVTEPVREDLRRVERR